LIKDEVLSAIDALENEGITASMAMLGNSVFTLSKNPEEITEKLDYIYLVSSIDNIGARLT
jgi:pantoate kinase